MPAPKKYDIETQQRAVRMYLDRVAEDDGISQLKARTEVGELLGINQSTLRNWIKRESKDPALGMVSSTPASAEVVKLRAEVARLKRANEILKTASAFFAAAELDRRLGQ
ncbi:transposase IS3/IS911 family protein [Xylanimonas cellulosilytica DSM 15894]|uniref:Transposase IS3/IS911 family protein n=1 Tax=Xylanimonas cellulosilytica (strain DSM 15894 / JCM 12276 / CECT 5975 / KCTC 9989 / LMG 20990 / NBRC 107835 / XIL07) TaxID=446471 RepID=D1BRN4_XYLCX|nr:transposase IS3/IS911 family protein [Xylanimonas cellulosilytica DSM 15894]ACZ32300.1 transposase IS3/IS911 family protein [Xylanimonas cellulosilytica DSM 15894]